MQLLYYNLDVSKYDNETQLPLSFNEPVDVGLELFVSLPESSDRSSTGLSLEFWSHWKLHHHSSQLYFDGLL